MTGIIDEKYADYDILPTPKGIFRFTALSRGGSTSVYLMIVALEEDGGITLDNGLTYFTSKDRFMRCDSARNARLENKLGGSFPFRPRKGTGKSFGPYAETFSIEAQEVYDLIFDEYIANRLPNVPPYDVDFETRVHETRRVYLERVRYLKIETEKVLAATKAEFDALDEEHTINHADEDSVERNFDAPFRYSNANYARIAFDE
jgi:hypothetical protein